MIKLLAKSNFRKNRGTNIGIFLLIFMAAMLMSLVLLINGDVKPTAEKDAKRLNSGDGYLSFTVEEGVNEDYIMSLIGDDAKEVQFQECVLPLASMNVPFGEGKVSNAVYFTTSDRFDNKIDRVEIVKEDASIDSNYIYLPYQFYTAGGVKIGDDYKFEMEGEFRQYTVKGFINTTYFGCSNAGAYEFILDDESYSELKNEFEKYNRILVNYVLKDGLRAEKFNLRVMSSYTSTHPTGNGTADTFEAVLANKTFMSDILSLSFIMITVIIIAVTSLMLSNSIKNYIRENMTNIGALKAMGYTGGNIRSSLVMLFGGLALAAGLLGGLVSYLLVPVMAGVFEGQAGVPYTPSINPAITVFTLLFTTVFTVFVTLAAGRKLKKVEVVTALRDGLESHNFKKNRLPLEKTGLPVNHSLALKTLFTNLRQNIITFFVTGILVFVCVIALLMYENFNRKPMISIMASELASGAVVVSSEDSAEVEEFLRQEGAGNLRYMIDMGFLYKDEACLMTMIHRDIDKMVNKDIVYMGNLPKYDNEIAVSGKFAKDFGYEIGDEVTLSGANSYSYIITGLIQSCSNGGRQAVMTEEAANHLVNMSEFPTAIWFDCDDAEKATKILNNCGDRFGNRIISLVDMNELVEGTLITFKGITTIMLISMVSISAVVIMLILYLFIKTLLYNKRKDYGIYKALGYTSKDLILQTALSFMPTIILSVAIFSVVSYFTANKYMQLVMVTFGMMKCSFAIPIAGVVIVGLGLILISFLFAIFQARKIKNIEAYNMLTEF